MLYRLIINRSIRIIITIFGHELEYQNQEIKYKYGNNLALVILYDYLISFRKFSEFFAISSFHVPSVYPCTSIPCFYFSTTVIPVVFMISLGISVYYLEFALGVPARPHHSCLIGNEIHM